MKTNVPYLSFNGGEVDTYTLARTDLDIAPHVAEKMENVFLTLQGAMELAPGSQYIGETPGDAQVWLRPWAFDTMTKYCLELSSGLVRFIYGTGYQTLPGAAATVGTFADNSAAPSGGGGSPAVALTVTVTNGSWTFDYETKQYMSEVTFTVTGGTGVNVVIIVNYVSGSGNYTYSSVDGIVDFTSSGNASSTLTLTIVDDAGNTGTSANFTVS